MGITFTGASVALVLGAVFAGFGVTARTVLLSAAALLAGMGIYGVCRFFNHLRGGKSFEDWGVAAVLAGFAMCGAVIWQATKPSGPWLAVLLLIMILSAFFVLVGVGVGVGHFVDERSKRCSADSKLRGKRSGRAVKSQQRPLSRFEKLMLLATIVAACIAASGSLVAAVIQRK